MKNDFPSENTIRQYLLGRLDHQEEFESSLSEQMLFNEELSEIVDSIEDEIIEDYLDGNLSREDRRAADTYFLRPRQRQEKLHLARLLRQHFEAKQGLVKKKSGGPDELAPQLVGGSRAATFDLRAYARTYWMVAMLALTVVSGWIYMSRLRKDLQSRLEAAQKNEAKLTDELAQERDHSASLTRQLQQLQPPVASLTFLGPIFRDVETPAVEIRPWTQRIKVSIDLPGASSRKYDVRLETKARQPIWAQAELAGSSNGLTFELPTQGISTGIYCFTLSSVAGRYCFRAEVKK